MNRLMIVVFFLLAAPALAEDGKDVSRKGEIIDTVCYFSKGAHGAAHKACAQMCLKNGNPAALLSDGKLYGLLADHGAEAAMADVKAHAGDEVTVSGKEITKDGMRVIFVSAVK